MIKSLRESIEFGFSEYGIKFLPRLLLFPFMVIALVVLTIAHDRIRGEQ